MKSLLTLIIISLSIFSYGQDTVTVYFDHDKHTLEVEEQNKITFFTEESDRNIIIESIYAFCDTTGSESYNKDLAQRRLNLVKTLLSDIPVGLTSARGEVIASHEYVANKARRVDIIYSELKTAIVVTDPIEEKPATLEDGITEFIESEAEDLSFDLSIHFIPGQWQPLSESYDELNRLVQIMKANSEINAHLHGHVCCTNNQMISEKRAEFVYLYLIKNGISKDRLDYEGHGNTQLKKSPDLTEADHIQNRRVNVVFTKK